MQLAPHRAASIAAISIFFIAIMASKARLAAGSSLLVVVSMSRVICQDSLHLSLHYPHILSAPPLPSMASNSDRSGNGVGKYPLLRMIPMSADDNKHFMEQSPRLEF
jgi:hypothetical protein